MRLEGLFGNAKDWQLDKANKELDEVQRKKKLEMLRNKETKLLEDINETNGMKEECLKLLDEVRQLKSVRNKQLESTEKNAELYALLNELKLQKELLSKERDEYIKVQTAEITTRFERTADSNESGRNPPPIPEPIPQPIAKPIEAKKAETTTKDESRHSCGGMIIKLNTRQKCIRCGWESA